MKRFNKDDLMQVQVHNFEGKHVSTNLFATLPPTNLDHIRFSFHYDMKLRCDWSVFAADPSGEFIAERCLAGWVMDITELANVFDIPEGYRNISRASDEFRISDLLVSLK